MSELNTSTKHQHKPGLYEIRIKGHLDDHWTDWFEGLNIILEKDGNTLLTGPLKDQAAMFGLLKKVCDLGMSLVSVSLVEPDPATTLGTDQIDPSGNQS